MSYYRSDYIDKIMKDLNIVSKPRFFYQKSNFHLKPHIDFGTQCGVNILLSDDPVPINIEGKIIITLKHLLIYRKNTL